ncbi:MAG: Asp-tRNA(Asn)/Glu-tRNA(Gln) amidotransferase subunit GatB [Parcubacteria group bacterium]|nr:Asp-tRNA(Asn)/Glu-tRNA(Gln) amidotransferase subunit GatB [Parcubacteria group bacterium]
MDKYTLTVGLEIHAELKTQTKMFCDSLNDPLEKRPNVNVCPVCMGHPGTLPVANKEAVKKVLFVGKALGGKLADYSQFDRKNYFYPDIPKGYQISQYKYPLVSGGTLNGVEITRIHLEEDTGKLLHDDDPSSSHVDYNRAGIPLMELVTEPCITSAKQASEFAQELQLLLRYLDVSDADMEKGLMRVEANISLAPLMVDRGGELGLNQSERLVDRTDLQSKSVLGTKVEVKNLNSFRSVLRAIEYEAKRQSEILDKGEKIVHETRGFDEVKGITYSQREKELAHDYRYFPEPDLPPLKISELDFGDMPLPELPWEKRERFKKDYGLADEKILNIFIQEKSIADFLEKTAVILKEDSSVKLAVNYITTDLLGLMKDKGYSFADIKITPENFAKLIRVIKEGSINSRAGKDVLALTLESGEDPEAIIKEKGLTQTSDESALEEVAKEIIESNPNAVADYKAGKENALKFFIGQGMAKTRGSANPKVLEDVFKKLLE